MAGCRSRAHRRLHFVTAPFSLGQNSTPRFCSAGSGSDRGKNLASEEYRARDGCLSPSTPIGLNAPELVTCPFIYLAAFLVTPAHLNSCRPAHQRPLGGVRHR